MIVVTRRNQEKIFINPTQIEMLEQHEDTLITLTSGKKLIVIENSQEINHQLLDWWRSVFRVNYFPENNDNQ